MASLDSKIARLQNDIAGTQTVLDALNANAADGDTSKQQEIETYERELASFRLALTRLESAKRGAERKEDAFDEPRFDSLCKTMATRSREIAEETANFYERIVDVSLVLGRLQHLREEQKADAHAARRLTYTRRRNRFPDREANIINELLQMRATAVVLSRALRDAGVGTVGVPLDPWVTIDRPRPPDNLPETPLDEAIAADAAALFARLENLRKRRVASVQVVEKADTKPKEARVVAKRRVDGDEA